jgi:hypothetical protein
MAAWRNVMSQTTNASVVTIAPNSFFEPDILTGHQYLKVFRAKGHLGPEERLMFAVLSDAVECFQKYLGANGRRCQRLFLDAETWIKCRESRWPYSFEHICEVLDLNPNYLRIGLMRWRLDRESQKLPRRRIREPLRYRRRMNHKQICV